MLSQCQAVKQCELSIETGANFDKFLQIPLNLSHRLWKSNGLSEYQSAASARITELRRRLNVRNLFRIILRYFESFGIIRVISISFDSFRIISIQYEFNMTTNDKVDFLNP